MSGSEKTDNFAPKVKSLSKSQIEPVRSDIQSQILFIKLDFGLQPARRWFIISQAEMLMLKAVKYDLCKGLTQHEGKLYDGLESAAQMQWNRLKR